MIQDALSMLTYDPSTGDFHWAVQRSRVKAGSKAGSLTDEGYVAIKVNDRSYKAHRLAWLFSYGDPIPEFIDHINGNKSDNRIVNLREATRAQNQANSRAKKNKLKGAYYRKDGGYWRSMIQVDGVLIRLGNFCTEQEAHDQYCMAASVIFGEFANPGHR